MVPLGIGKQIFQAVAIAALSALFTKTIEAVVDEVKEKRKEKRDKKKEQKKNE